MNYLALCIAAGLIVCDQLIKQWALAVLEPAGQIVVIPGLFNLTYVENRGAAFGILQNQTALLSLFSLAVLVIALYGILSGKIKDRLLLCGVSLVLAGGSGNVIDRILRGFVVDYLDFSALMNFPVFNFADCCVVTGTGLILLFVLLAERREKRDRKKNAPHPDAAG